MSKTRKLLELLGIQKTPEELELLDESAIIAMVGDISKGIEEAAKAVVKREILSTTQAAAYAKTEKEIATQYGLDLSETLKDVSTEDRLKTLIAATKAKSSVAPPSADVEALTAANLAAQKRVKQLERELSEVPQKLQELEQKVANKYEIAKEIDKRLDLVRKERGWIDNPIYNKHINGEIGGFEWVKVDGQFIATKAGERVLRNKAGAAVPSVLTLEDFLLEIETETPSIKQVQPPQLGAFVVAPLNEKEMSDFEKKRYEAAMQAVATLKG